MNLEYLKHNVKIISLEIQELEEEIILLMQKILTKKTILQHDKYNKQISIYRNQLSETRKQIKQWKI
jgi:5-bromo-4-chloroindolyl phosphate hydrolysis protein